MKTFKYKKRVWWLVSLTALFAIYSFVGCGKKNDGGPALQNPGLTGVSNNCGPFGCFGATTGQQITRAMGSLKYDDNLDSNNNGMGGPFGQPNRLMDLMLNINMWQSNSSMMGGMGGMPGMMNYPMSPNGYTYSSGTQLAYYSGPVQISGQLMVVAPVSGCNIPPGNFNVQPLQVGMLNRGFLTVMLAVNVNGGQGFTVNLQGLNVVANNMGPIGGNIGMQPMTSSQSRLLGVVSIHECGDSTFRVE